MSSTHNGHQRTRSRMPSIGHSGSHATEGGPLALEELLPRTASSRRRGGRKTSSKQMGWPLPVLATALLVGLYIGARQWRGSNV